MLLDCYRTRKRMIQRRTFLYRIVNAAFALPLSWFGMSYIFPSLFQPRATVSKIKLGSVDELFKERNYLKTTVGEIPAIILKSDNNLRAYSLQCTHAQCTVQYAESEQRFVCPCHGGIFNVDGSVHTGPPQRALHQLFVSVHDGVLYISNRLLS